MREQIAGPIFGVLGNHDTIRMVPGWRRWGFACCSTRPKPSCAAIERIHLVGIDDAHYYRVDNIEKAVSQLPGDGFSILLSHTPEIYRQAAHADFDLMLSGHTHGGQICLPGAIPITLDAKLPRRMGSGLWKYITTWSGIPRSASGRASSPSHQLPAGNRPASPALRCR